LTYKKTKLNFMRKLTNLLNNLKDR